MLPQVLRILGFLVFTSVVFYFSTLYVFYILFTILGKDWKQAWYISAITTVITAVVSITVKFYSSLFSRIIYYIMSYWWAILLYTFLGGILYQIINAIVGLSMGWGLFVFLVPAGLLFLYGTINIFCLKIENIDVYIPNLKQEVRIAHLSDLHLGPIYNKEYSEKIVKILLRENPDFVVITGDLFDGSMKLTEDMVEPFNALPMNIYFVLGNHDLIVSGIEDVLRIISRTKIILIRNEQIVYKGLNIIGIDYSQQWGYLADKLSWQDLSDQMPNILLYHVPELSADELEKYKVNLHLAGHTHGGQMFPMMLTIRCAYPYVKGLYKSTSGKTSVYVSEGTGSAGPALRTFTRNTIAFINLHA